MAPLFLVQMSGVPGSGKSTIARRIHQRINAIVIDNDICRSAALDCEVEPVKAGKVSYLTSQSLARSFLNQGFSVVLDSPCRFQEILDAGLQIAEDTHACYRYVECITEDLSVIRRRLKSRTPLRSQFTDIDSLPALVEDGVETLSGEERFRHWMRSMKHPENSYLRLDTSRPVEECLCRLFEFLEECVEE